MRIKQLICQALIEENADLNTKKEAMCLKYRHSKKMEYSDIATKITLLHNHLII
jgi:hypothetical protein